MLYITLRQFRNRYLFVLAGVASAATEFVDLSKSVTSGGITYTSPGEGQNQGSFTGSIAEAGGGGVAHTGVALTLNLSSILDFYKSSTTDVSFINFDNNKTDLGLALTMNGITATHAGTVWNDDRNFTISYDKLKAASWEGADSNTYVTITVCQSQASGPNGGIMVYSSTEKLGGAGALGYSTNSVMNAIQINTDYVISTSISPGWTDQGAATQLAGALAKSTETAISLSVPEPTTATLSLLALAGLAARRRRASR